MLSLSLLIVATGFAYDRQSYYAQANGKSGQSLKTALFGIIGGPKVVSYDGLIEAYEKTDTRPDGYVRDWYSNTTRFRHGTDKAGSYKKEGDCYNREHSVPQSWFGKASPMRSDIVHVIPTDGYVNNRRSSFPFGEVGSATYQSNNGYSKLGSAKSGLGYTGTVFEPNDEVKGDIARIYFYMVTCYQNKCTGWSGGVFTGTTYQPLAKWAFDMFMRWSKQDPVDNVERARNEAVMTVQGNRNPFVDFPGLEQYVWGDYKETPISVSDYVDPSSGYVPTLKNPTITFATSAVTLQEGDTYKQTAQTNSDGTLTYVSSSPSVATVDSRTGLVRALSVGTTVITAVVSQTATYASASASYTVTVGSGNPEPSDGTVYERLVSNSSDFSGTYLIVYEEDEKALNSANVSGEKGNYIPVTISGSQIAVTRETEAAEFQIVKKAGGYSIRAKSGVYIGHASGNDLSSSTSDSFTNTITVSGGEATIASGSYSLRFNVSADRFRFYTSGQQSVSLYRRTKADAVQSPSADAAAVPVYDLSGRPLKGTSSTPGIYIQGGRKYLRRY